MPPTPRTTAARSLSSRLRAAFNACDLDRPVWDVGCDHGALGVAALLAGAPQVHFLDRVPGIIAALATKMPLGVSEERFAHHCADAETCAHRADGNLVLCGMGGERIANIIHNMVPASGALRVIYDAHSSPEQPVAALTSLGFAHQSEREVNERGRIRHVVMFTRDA